MSAQWSVVPAPRGGGMWFIAEREDGVQAFAAPGVWLPAPQRGLVRETTSQGWRCAWWPARPGLAVDRDIPIETYVLSTHDVCEEMPRHMREQVREIMVSQLQVALCLGQPDHGRLVEDDAAHASVAAATWIIGELEATFPGEYWELPPSAVTPRPIPETSDELLAHLPPPLEMSLAMRRPLEALRTRELVRMLAAAVIRRALLKVGWAPGWFDPPPAVVVTRAECQEHDAGHRELARSQ